MYVRILRWEIYVEKVPPSEKLIDWYFSVGENHIWMWILHVLFNKRVDQTNGRTQTDEASHTSARGT